MLKEVNKEEKQRLEENLSNSLFIYTTLTNEQTEKQIKNQMLEQMPIEQKQQLEKLSVLEIVKNMPEEQSNMFLEEVLKKKNETQDMMVEQLSIMGIRELYKDSNVNTEKIQSDYILSLGIQMLGIALLSMGSAITILFLSARVAATFGKSLREKVFTKVMKFSNKELTEFSTASLITRNTNDIQQIQQLMTILFRVVIYAPVLGIGGFIKVLTQTNNQMGWIIGVAILGIITVIFTLFIILMPSFKKLQSLIDKLNLVSREILTGLPVIRAFNKEKTEEKRFNNASNDLKKVNVLVNKGMSTMMPLLMLIMNVIMILIVWVGAKNIEQGSMQVGDMMAFIQYTTQIVMAFLMISMVSIMLPRASVSAKRINEILDTDILVKDKEKTVAIDKSKKGLVEFKNVSFKYPDADAEVLSDITFTAKPGETTAIIGSTGSGKSTVIKLIPRFYDVTGGNLYVNGIDVKDVKQKDLREIIGYVPQKGVLFSGTIKSNIKFSDEKMSNEQMKNVAKISQATEFIEQKEEKYDSEIAQGGSNVSGGQKQRLSIARAVAKDAQILIFDDSFSALDYKTDVTLRQALKSSTKDATVIIIAQRVGTILDADIIHVLDEGKIIASGTHKELLKTCEAYYEIASTQLSKEELANE